MMKQNLDRYLKVFRVAYQLQNKRFCGHRNFAIENGVSNDNEKDYYRPEGSKL